MHLLQRIPLLESDKVTMNRASPPTHRLYAMPHSLYSARAQPYRHFQLQRVTELYAARTDNEQKAVGDLLERCGFEPLLKLSLSRRIERQGNLECWGS